MTPTVVWLHELRREDAALAGGKGANLGELIHAGAPVPPGFVVTAEAYRHYIAQTNVGAGIADTLRSFDPRDRAALEDASQRIKRLFQATAMPKQMARDVRRAYAALGRPSVAVRSSATAEDLPDASFAGQQSTFLNIMHADWVIEAVRACWSSLFEPQALFYRARLGYDEAETAIAVPVQRMVRPRSAGIMFTVHPVSAAADRVFIEAVWGLGEAAVSGLVTPDAYVVEKRTGNVMERSVVRQERELVGDPDARGLHATVWKEVPAALRDVPKLSPEQTTALASVGVRLETHFGCPQDIEWAIDEAVLFVLQSRPVTTLSQPSS